MGMISSLQGLDQSNKLRQILARGSNVNGGMAPQARLGKTKKPGIGRPKKMMDNQMPSPEAMKQRLMEMQQGR